MKKNELVFGITEFHMCWAYWIFPRSLFSCCIENVIVLPARGNITYIRIGLPSVEIWGVRDDFKYFQGVQQQFAFQMSPESFLSMEIDDEQGIGKICYNQ